jgi:hypothetical protein
MRGPLLFIFNFHPTDSYERYSVGVEEAGEYQVGVNVFVILLLFRYGALIPDCLKHFIIVIWVRPFIQRYWVSKAPQVKYINRDAAL